MNASLGAELPPHSEALFRLLAIPRTFYYSGLKSPVLKCHVNGIMQFVLLCVWFLSLSVMFLRLAQVSVHIG